MSIGRASIEDRGEIVPEGTLGFRKKSSNGSMHLGPGFYTVRDDKLRHSTPSITIPKAAKNIAQKNLGPSCTRYNV